MGVDIPYVELEVVEFNVLSDEKFLEPILCVYNTIAVKVLPSLEEHDVGVMRVYFR